MRDVNVYCEGPGPHEPPSGLLGETLGEDDIHLGCCPACAGWTTEAETVTAVVDPTLWSAAAADVHAASTLTQLRAAVVKVMSAVSSV